MTPTDSLPLQNTHLLWTFFKSATRSFTDRRFSLWLALFGLVVALLVTLVWLAGRYEASQYQAELDRDTADAVTDIRNCLLYTSDAADEEDSVDLGGRRIIKKKK